MKKTISLNDKNYFEMFIGNRVTKTEIFNSKDKIPVYSANVFEPFGFLSKSNIENFSNDYILWSIDNSNFQFNSIKRGKIFATTDHCGALRILNKNILVEYLLFELELQIQILGFDRNLRPSLSNMERVNVKIPIDKTGNFDVESQKEIIKKYMALKSLNNDLKSEINELSQITFSIEELKIDRITLRIDEIFDLSKTTNKSYFTKEFINENKGDIPVYSASKNPDFVNYGYVKDNLPKINYFENCLTWNIDGSVGKAFYRKSRFSLSEKVVPLILHEKWKNIIDETYVKYILEKKAVERGFAFSNKAGKSKIEDIEIEIPAKKVDGQLIPDIEKQKLLAKEFGSLYDIKINLVQYLQGLSEVSVDI